MKSGLFDDGDDGEQNGVGFVETSERFAMQNAFFVTKPFD